MSKNDERRKNYEAIKALLDEVRTELDWYLTPDGLDHIDDKGKYPESMCTSIIADVLETAYKRGFNYRSIILHAVLRFSIWHGAPGPVYNALRDIHRLKE